MIIDARMSVNDRSIDAQKYTVYGGSQNDCSVHVSRRIRIGLLAEEKKPARGRT